MTSPKPIPFETFMQMALHDPVRGYYARNITAIGGRGDFTTAPMRSTALAKTIARWVVESMRETETRNLIEIGPGDGTLAANVWKFLPMRTRWRAQLHLVESSPPLTRLQQSRLPRHVRWHRTIDSALAACNGNAVIYSNELVDAFPVRRFELTDDGWREIAVTLESSGLASESLMPAAVLPESSIFDRPHPHGQRVEVHASYRQWLHSWLPAWNRGRMLTIDYGAIAESLYARRPHGTIRGYLMQHRIEGLDIYQNIGRQDLTADVNFTDLLQWSDPWTRDSRVDSLAGFLDRSGCTEDAFLMDPDGAGHAFKVLDQRAGHQD